MRAADPSVRSRRRDGRAGGSAQLAAGSKISVNDHALLCSTLVRIAQRIGINRRANEVLDASNAECILIDLVCLSFQVTIRSDHAPICDFMEDLA